MTAQIHNSFLLQEQEFFLVGANGGKLFQQAEYSIQLYNPQIDFSGGMLVASGSIQELHVHLGFHPTCKYETVFERVFSQGSMPEINGVNRQLAELQPGKNASGREVEE